MDKLLSPSQLGKKAFDPSPDIPEWFTSPHREICCICEGTFTELYPNEQLSEQAIALCIKLGL